MNEKPEALAERLAAGRLAMVEQLTDEVDTLRRENERLREEVRNWKKSFVGHVYVKNEDYAELISKRDALKTENERLREALQLALNSHGKMLMSDPPQDAWKFHRVNEVIDAALRREETT